MKNYYEVFDDLLNMVGYEGDKKAFSDKFLDVCLKQFGLDLVKSLPEDKKDSLSKELTPETPAESKMEILKKYFSQEEVEVSFKKAINDITMGYFEALNPHLTDKQREDLKS